MLRHYLLTAVRHLVRHKLYTGINIVGLAIGLTCMILVVLFIRDQLSYDKWIPDTQNLYRVELTLHIPGRPPLNLAAVPDPMPAAMRDEIPGVTGMTRLHVRALTVAIGNRQFLQQVDVEDPRFFRIIQLPLIAGSPDTVFRQPESVVLSQSAARTYFGSTNPIGQVLNISTAACATGSTTCQNETTALRVTGIARNLPHDSQLVGDVFIPDTSIAVRSWWDRSKDDWFSENGWGYVSFAPGVKPAAVAAAMPAIFDKYVTPLIRKFGISVRGSLVYQVHLTRFERVHLDSSRWQFNLTAPGSWTTIYGVAAVGVLILLTACFNFMNLATALSLMRAREIGLRKIVGARRRQLVVQFLGEAVLMALLSLALALAAVEVLLPLLDRVLGRTIGLHYATDGGLLAGLVGIAVITGLVSGSYPAIVFSAFRPATAFGAGGPRQARSSLVRNVLVLIQFAVSIALGIAAGVVFNQIRYARDMDLGFRHDNMLVIRNSNLMGQREQDFADALRAGPGVMSVGLSSPVPLQTSQSLSLIQVPGNPAIITLNTVTIGPEFPATYGIPLVAGRLLSATRGGDRLNSAGQNGGDPGNEGRNVLVNAAAARRLGLSPQQAVGKTIVFNKDHVHIVGVLANSKIHGAREPATPSIYVYIPNSPMYISVRVRPASIPQTLRFVDRTWHAFVPAVAISHYFLDETFEGLYQQDDRQGTLFGVLVIVAILIGCLGLYGVAVFTAERRAKEIGVRKVSGARTRDIVRLMLWRMSVPVLVANVVAWPVAYLYLRRWLDGFAFRIPLDPVYFIGAGAIALLVAWATVYANTLRLARANPIHALRYE